MNEKKIHRHKREQLNDSHFIVQVCIDTCVYVYSLENVITPHFRRNPVLSMCVGMERIYG